MTRKWVHVDKIIIVAPWYKGNKGFRVFTYNALFQVRPKICSETLTRIYGWLCTIHQQLLSRALLIRSQKLFKAYILFKFAIKLSLLLPLFHSRGNILKKIINKYSMYCSSKVDIVDFFAKISRWFSSKISNTGNWDAVMHEKEFQFTLKKEFSSHDFVRAIAKIFT